MTLCGCFVETAERIELVFLHWSFLPRILLCVKRMLGICTNIRVLPAGTLSQYLQKILLLHGNVLSTWLDKMDDRSMMNWTIIASVN